MRRDLKFNVLSKQHLENHVDDFVRMSKRNIEDEYWEKENFLLDMSDKWRLSFYVTSGPTLAAFIIASRKAETVHIHKFVVDTPFQRTGLGTTMLQFLKSKINLPISLKVNTTNSAALNFYKKSGFEITALSNNLYTVVCDIE